jgi:phage terminase Nu1 subunit (DNA packaging protein)
MFLNQKEVAELLRVSIPTVLKYESYGMPVIRIGDMDPKYDREKILDWFNSFEKKQEN